MYVLMMFPLPHLSSITFVFFFSFSHSSSLFILRIKSLFLPCFFLSVSLPIYISLHIVFLRITLQRILILFIELFSNISYVNSPSCEVIAHLELFNKKYFINILLRELIDLLLVQYVCTITLIEKSSLTKDEIFILLFVFNP